MKKSYYYAIALVVLVILWVLSGYVFSTDTSQEDVANSEQNKTTDFVVEVTSLSAEPYTKSIVVRGHTKALRRVDLKTQTKGRVIKLPVDKGNRVEKGQIICQLAVDDRKARLAEAEALVKQRQLEYTAAQELARKGHRSETQQAAAEAQLDAAKANMARQEVELSHTLIKAPFDGFLDDRHVEVGDYMQEGDVCGLVMEEDPFLVTGNVAEKDIAFIKLGVAAKARLADGTLLDGKVRYISSIANADTRTFPVELEVANPDRILRDGITAELIIPTKSVMAHYMSPANLVINTAGVVGVRIVDDQRTVQFIPVDIIGSDEKGIWVKGPENEQALITVGQDFVTEGQKVEISKNLAEKTS